MAAGALAGPDPERAKSEKANGAFGYWAVTLNGSLQAVTASAARTATATTRAPRTGRRRIGGVMGIGKD